MQHSCHTTSTVKLKQHEDNIGDSVHKLDIAWINIDPAVSVADFAVEGSGTGKQKIN